MKKTDCLKCDHLHKLDKTYPHNLGIELKCHKTLEPRLIGYKSEDEMIKMAHNEYPYVTPIWCPVNISIGLASSVRA